MTDLANFGHNVIVPAMSTTLNISLPKQLRRFVESQVEQGGYGSASEYFRELLRTARRQRAQEQLEVKLLEGLSSNGHAMAAKGWDRLKAKVRARSRRRA